MLKRNAGFHVSVNILGRFKILLELIQEVLPKTGVEELLRGISESLRRKKPLRVLDPFLPAVGTPSLAPSLGSAAWRSHIVGHIDGVQLVSQEAIP